MADYVTYVGLFLSIIGFVLLSFIKGNEHWRYSTLLVGIALVILASLSFATLSGVGAVLDSLANEHKIDGELHGEARALTNIWIYVLPAVVGAIGANLISAWFLSKKPAQ